MLFYIDEDMNYHAIDEKHTDTNDLDKHIKVYGT